MNKFFKSILKYHLVVIFIVVSILVVFDIFNTFPQIWSNNKGLLMVGDIKKKSIEPMMLYIDTNDFSIHKINVSKIINSRFSGIHQIKSFTINNSYKITLCVYDPGKLIILSSENGLGNLKTEFEEELDERVKKAVLADIDDDGKEEIVVGTRPNGILKYYKFANGNWSGVEIDELNETIHDLIVTDSDNDGKNEIIVTTSVTEEKGNLTSLPAMLLKYELNKSQNKWYKTIISEFTRKTTRVGTENITIDAHPRYLFADDFDGDGLKEIVTNVINSGNLISFKWNGTGYSENIIEDSLMVNRNIITSSDIDNDGKNEIITITELNDALLMYKFEGSEWKRHVLTQDLVDDSSQNVISMIVLNSSSTNYKKILYVVNATNTVFNILEYKPNNVWERKKIGELKISINRAWGIYPVFSKLFSDVKYFE